MKYFENVEEFERLERIDELESLIQRAQRAYWEYGVSKWTDEEYDRMIEELKALKGTEDRIGAPVVASTGKVQHGWRPLPCRACRRKRSVPCADVARAFGSAADVVVLKAL